jgi:hypothetical protein
MVSPQFLSGSLASRLLELGEDAASDLVKGLDKSDPDLLTPVLNAMTEIAAKYVLPAAPLQSRSADGWAYFNLDDLAGYEYPGLISGILQRRFPVLAPPPPEPELTKELEEAGFAIDSPERRAAFFTGWMAIRAGYLLEALADHLTQTGAVYDPDQLDMLEALVRSDLGGSVRLSLSKSLVSASPERAKALRSAVAEPYLQEALED